jgi:IS5 family transposase
MKAHFGVDSRTKLIHAAIATPANVADGVVLPQLLHGNETRVWGDQAYRGQRGDPAACPEGEGLHKPPLPRRGRRDRAGEKPCQIDGAGQKPALAKAGVEHPIGVIKPVFGFVKVRYRGLAKNVHRLLVNCALANLFMARQHLLRCKQV